MAAFSTTTQPRSRSTRLAACGRTAQSRPLSPWARAGHQSPIPRPGRTPGLRCSRARRTLREHTRCAWPSALPPFHSSPPPPLLLFSFPVLPFPSPPHPPFGRAQRSPGMALRPCPYPCLLASHDGGNTPQLHSETLPVPLFVNLHRGRQHSPAAITCPRSVSLLSIRVILRIGSQTDRAPPLPHDHPHTLSLTANLNPPAHTCSYGYARRVLPIACPALHRCWKTSTRTRSTRACSSSTQRVMRRWTT
jgi:hypothetical protein